MHNRWGKVFENTKWVREGIWESKTGEGRSLRIQNWSGKVFENPERVREGLWESKTGEGRYLRIQNGSGKVIEESKTDERRSLRSQNRWRKVFENPKHGGGGGCDSPRMTLACQLWVSHCQIRQHLRPPPPHKKHKMNKKINWMRLVNKKTFQWENNEREII